MRYDASVQVGLAKPRLQLRIRREKTGDHFFCLPIP
jgi:hypothetical protein